MKRFSQIGLPLTAAALAAIFILASCGTQQSADLFLVKRTGKIPGANLTLLVSDDGTVRCNGASPVPLSNGYLLQARELTKQLAADKNRPIPEIGVVNPIYEFNVTLGAGSVSWQDGNPGVPESFKQVAYFTRKVAKQDCKLKR